VISIACNQKSVNFNRILTPRPVAPLNLRSKKIRPGASTRGGEFLSVFQRVYKFAILKVGKIGHQERGFKNGIRHG